MENVNSELIKTDEDKKWVISRIDMYHHILIDSLKSMQDRYEGAATKSSTQIKDVRNYVLTGFGIFLTLFLGYSSLYPFEQWLFFTVIIPTAIIALILFMIFNWLNSIIVQLFSDLTVILQTQEYHLLYSQGYVVSSVAFLPRITPQFLANYHLFTSLLTNAVFATMAKEYTKLSKKYSVLKDLKDSLKKEAKEFEKSIQLVSELYSQLDKTQNLPPQLTNFVDDSLKKYLKQD